jgi:glycosyltransferase involved in cell wall biosynthesis
MKVVFTHTDFRIYWPARLDALNIFLKSKGIAFEVVEIAGRGSPYDFAEENYSRPAYWHCLFPEQKIEDINSKLANRILRKKLNELLPDIVFSGAIAYPSGAAAVRWANDNNKKCVIFDNARLQDVPRKGYIDFVKKRIYSAVDAILCPAPDWGATFSYFGFSFERLFYGLNVVDNDIFGSQIKSETTDIVYSRYLLAVGRQIPQKNFVFLIKAYHNYIKISKNPLKLIFVGGGHDHEILKSYVLVNDLSNSIHFIPFLPQQKLKILYKNAAWFILPSLGETWGLVVNEAMASGLPILVSNQVGCASTLVKHGVNGFIFSPNDENELVSLLCSVGAIDSQELEMMSKRSIEIISNWGLNRFCSGTYEAIKYVTTTIKRKPNLISKLIIFLWKGRYRPV